MARMVFVICAIVRISHAFSTMKRYKKQCLYVGNMRLSPKYLNILIYSKIFQIQFVSIFSQHFTKRTYLQTTFRYSNCLQIFIPKFLYNIYTYNRLIFISKLNSPTFGSKSNNNNINIFKKKFCVVLLEKI